MLIAASVMEFEDSKLNDLYKRLMCSTPQGTKTYYIRHNIGRLFSFRGSKKWFNTVENLRNV